MIKFLRAKLHGIYVTDANLEYHGSITLDPEYCKNLCIYPLEFVEIWNKNNGERFSTYVIYGTPGSKCCILNGSAARKCQVKDQLIIAAYHFVNPETIQRYRAMIMTFNPDNSIYENMEYILEKNEDHSLDFQTKRISY
jgi:aspartate 1-decarboxylase